MEVRKRTICLAILSGDIHLKSSSVSGDVSRVVFFCQKSGAKKSTEFSKCLSQENSSASQSRCLGLMEMSHSGVYIYIY